MALRLIEGFETGNLDPIGSLTFAGSIQTANVRAGSGARYLDLTDVGSEFRFNEVPWDAANDTLYVGAAVNCRTAMTGGAFLSCGGYPTGQPSDDSWVNLIAQTDGSIDVYTDQTDLQSGGNLLFSTATGVMVADTWHYIEVEFLCHESTGTVEVWVDGASVGSFGPGDTQAEVTAGNKPDVAVLYLATHGGSADTEFDDIYILDTNTTSPETGTSPNIARLGDIVIEALLPTSDSTPNQFTRSAGANNWELVDEIPSDGDTTYVESSTVAHEDRYGLGNRVHTGGVVGVSIHVEAKKTDANARSLDVALVSNAGVTVDASPVNLTLANGTYTVGQKTYDRDFHDEVTAADWTNAKVNALETSTVVV